MQSLSPEKYQYLATLAQVYRDTHLQAIKQRRHWNPRLGVDSLCFEQLDAAISGSPLMAGALITPCELSLMAVPDQTMLQATLPETLSLELPSGCYSLTLERLPGGYDIYLLRILEDLSELESMQEAARLAQQMMRRLMTPE